MHNGLRIGGWPLLLVATLLILAAAIREASNTESPTGLAIALLSAGMVMLGTWSGTEVAQWAQSRNTPTLMPTGAPQVAVNVEQPPSTKVEIKTDDEQA